MGNKRLIVSVILVIVIITAGLGYAHIAKNNKNKNQKEAEIIVKDEKVKAIDEGIDTSNWDLNKVKIEYDTESVPVPVPIGWTASGAEGEHTVNTGFVIYEGTGAVNNENAWEQSKTRNQFVWVPVPDPSRIYEKNSTTGKIKAKLWNFTATGKTAISNGDTDSKLEVGILTSGKYDNIEKFTKYNAQGYTKDMFYKELESEFNRAMKSIEKYNGFYIGRYETGNVTSIKPVIRRLNDNIGRWQNWYQLYLRMKNIGGSNKNIQTGIIWGCLWNETTQWLIDTGEKTRNEIVSNSTSWGNYYDVEFTYTKTNGETATKTKKYAIRIPTGSTERNKINNIYDMAGNVSDYTLEIKKESNSNIVTSARVSRGGGVNLATYPLSYRYYGYPNTTSDVDGYRAYMYIQ